MRPRFSRRADAAVIKLKRVFYEYKNENSLGKTEGGRMVHSALLGPPNTSVYRYRRGKNRRGGTASLPAPPAGVPKPSKYGVGLRKRRAAILTDGLP